MGHLGRFADGPLGTDGQSLADPLSNGIPASRRGNQGVYGVIDQQIYRLADDPTKGVGVFARVTGAPGDRNLIDFYADPGNFTGRYDVRIGIEARHEPARRRIVHPAAVEMTVAVNSTVNVMEWKALQDEAESCCGVPCCTELAPMIKDLPWITSK